ncbi:MAG: hypothetical protein HC837_06945 [Chloroflexaceae bacterium]|nr:hypothetical protein [Chloroflexaceae bacterium]
MAFGLVAVEAHRRSGSWRLAALAMLLTAAMSINALTTRTQNWSWLPYMLVLIVLGSYVAKQLSPRWLVALPLMMIFWVNAHGAFILGLLITGAFVAGETMQRLLKQAYALTWDRLKLLYLAFGSMILVTVFNPLGIGVFAYVLDLLTDAPSQRLINEWQTPDPRSIAGAFFYFSVLVVIASFAFARRRPSITDVLLVCGLAWMSFTGGALCSLVWHGGYADCGAVLEQAAFNPQAG